MRALMVVVLLLVASVAMAQSAIPAQTDQKYTVAVDTTKVNIVQQVDQILSAVEKHGTGPLAQVYRAAVRKQMGVIFLLLAAAVGCLFFGIYWNLEVGRERDKLDDPNATDKMSKDSIQGWHMFTWALNFVGVAGPR